MGAYRKLAIHVINQADLEFEARSGALAQRIEAGRFLFVRTDEGTVRWFALAGIDITAAREAARSSGKLARLKSLEHARANGAFSTFQSGDVPWVNGEAP